MFGNRSRIKEETEYKSSLEYVCMCGPFWEYVFDDEDEDIVAFGRRYRNERRRRRSKSLTRMGSEKKEKPRRRGFSRMMG